MIIISHGGNLNGNAQTANTQTAVDQALAAGFDAMVDVWLESGQYMIGIDSPTEAVGDSWLRRPRMWCRARSGEALQKMQEDMIHCFWMDESPYTVTSRNGLLCNTGFYLPKGIATILGGPGEFQGGKDSIAGVCTDNPIAWREWIIMS